MANLVNTKFLMLGASNCEITCYMLRTYNKIKRGIHGFTFDTNDKDKATFTKQYEEMKNPDNSGVMPGGTSEMSSYQFDLVH